MRLAVAETQIKNYDDKFDDIKEAIEKWNRIGFWLITVMGGSFILALMKFIYDGGLVPAAKAIGF